MRDKTKKIILGPMIPAVTFTVVGGLHGNEKEEVRSEEPHTHLEEFPDTKPVGHAAIPVLASGVAIKMDMSDMRYYIVKSGDKIWLRRGFRFPSARIAGESR